MAETTYIDKSNTMFQLALDLVNQSTRNIFLTGKAGTGKTTFLRYIREHCSKQMAVVAPTGVAAINAGGVTIHSFFQLPFSPFIPDDNGTIASDNEEVTHTASLLNRLRMNKEKLRVLEELELLVIDEISMVRCDTLDAIDTVLRFVRKRPLQRFGGVQVLFIGDMFQLPPVTRDEIWQWLSAYYRSPYFFDSRVLQEELPVYIEFNKVYRQSEEHFINLLNQVRNNELDEDGARLLEERYLPDFVRTPQDGFILLTTHNEIVRQINTAELQKLQSEHFSFAAEINGDFPSNSFPADETLVLCPGAQVMFIKNDTDRGKRFFNGKIGIVSRIEGEKIWVQCGDETEIEVKREQWENIRYTVNHASRSMEEETLGSFSQFPLRLAWAITIHKSQGLTFEKAIVDAGKAFAPGQVYVALSRCTNLEGLVLKSRISSSSLRTDPRIVDFAHNSASAEMLRQELMTATQQTRIELLFLAFDFTKESEQAGDVGDYIRKQGPSFQKDSITWVEILEKSMLTIKETGDRFHGWIKQQLQLPLTIDENVQLGERVKRASIHFSNELQQVAGHLQACAVSTDNRNHARQINESLRELFNSIMLHQFMLQGFTVNTDLDSWQQKKRSFPQPSFSINVYGGSIEAKKGLAHPALYWQLKQLRDSISAKRDQPLYLIASSKTLEELVSFLPQTEDELEQVSGFGKVKIKSYGNDFLEVIRAYSQENGLSSQMPVKKEPAKKKKKEKEQPVKDPPRQRTDTKAESYRLFRDGKSINEIAGLRGFTQQTIEGHLAHYIQSGEIAIEELVPPGVVSIVNEAITGLEVVSVGSIKNSVGDMASFGEIRFVMAWNIYNKNKDQTNESLAG